MSSIFEEQISSDELFDGIKEDLALCITMEITHRCNYKCVHCYGAFERTEQDMDYEQLTGIIDQFSEHGTLDVSLTGGEPLARPDFCDLYVYTRKKGIFVNVLTNASLLTNKHIDVFLEYPVSHLSITMYGFSQDVFERVTGVPGSYGKFMRAIKMLKANQIQFELKSVATTINKHEMFAIRDFADELEVPFRYSTKLIPENNGCRNPLCYALSPEEMLWFDINDERRFKAWEYVVTSPDSDHQHQNSRKGQGHRFLCHAGDKDVSISADGKLHLCLNERRSGYDLLNGSLDEGYADYVRCARDEEAPPLYKCLTCSDIKYCDHCAAEIGLVGDFEYGKHPTCRLAQMRRQYFEGSTGSLAGKPIVNNEF